MTDPTETTLVASALRHMQAEVYEVNKAKGWRGEGTTTPTFLEAMALLHTEISEAVDAWRVHGLADATEPGVSYFDGTEWARHPAKPEGVGSELADVLIRLLDDADLFGIDLAAEYTRKVAYNRTRAFRHGGKRL